MMMDKRTLFSMLCLLGLILSACVPKEKYVELENQHSSTQAQLAAEQKQLADLQAKYQRLQNTNMSLLNTLEDLKFELRQEKTVVTEKEQAIAELELLRRKIEDSLKEELAEKDKTISELDDTRQEIEASLKDQIAQKDIQIKEIEGKLQVTFVNRILFSSGSVKIKDKGQEVLQKLAESFRDTQDQNIVVEGHTDDVQIGQGLQNLFPTNWELSTARASAVVRFLYEKGEIEPERLTASGFSYFQPVASNLTVEGRAQNRRIEIILIPLR